MENLILKYYRGNYSRKDLEQVKELFVSEGTDAQLTDIMKVQWNLAEDTAMGDKERFDCVLEQIHLSIGSDIRRTLAMRQFFIGFAKIAAILMIPLLGAFLFLLHQQHSKGKMLSQNVISAPRGAVKEVALPDGTKVWLNSGSSVSYSESFNKKIREVNLAGEAYFEVTKNPKKPFVVHASEVAVRVLGTKFDVKSYREDPSVNVTLMEGSVRLTDAQPEPAALCMLRPNQQAVFSKKNNRLLVRTVDARNANEWTKGNLMFDDEELDQISRCLEREYGVKICFQDNEIRHLRFFGKFKKTQTIDQILSIVVSRQNFHYTRKGDTVVFSNNQ